MPKQTEPNANNALGILLQGMMRGCNVRSENTQALVDHPGRHPDILITEAGRAPIIIESEFEPARNVEDEAEARLGLEVVEGRRTVEAVIALRYPGPLAYADDLNAALSSARLSYCVLYAEESESRFPESGWLGGSVSDLADLIRLVSVPQKAVNDAADALERGIERVAAILDELADQQSYATMEIANLLGMSDVPQTRRMACAIIANALVFHERIVGMHEGVRPLRQVCGPDVANPQAETLAAWDGILKINYWPIFAVGRDILNQIPSDAAARILNTLELTAGEVNATGVDNSHDLTGRIFQRLIADRKYLATFYTLPASAALLARLAVAKMDGVDWSDSQAIGKLRVGDFACGTGALLSAAYEQIASRHERAGGDPAALHTNMMEEVLYGCDVMPSAAHITSSTLSGTQPNVGFGKSRIYTMPYGRLSDGAVAIGSLNYLKSDSQMTFSNLTDPALRTGSVGEETSASVMVDIPHEGFDMVIMNPPFTRPGSDWEGSERAEDYIKHFKGLSTGLVTQLEMAKSLSQYTKDTCYHGYAGIASAFAALAHKKIKPGGVLALVLPLSAASGLSWKKFREMLAREYMGLTVLTIGAADNDGLSFSADTGMAECLVIARKLTPDKSPDGRALFTSLRRRPQDFAHSSSLASEVVDNSQVRKIEDGPFGGTPLMIGAELAGETIAAPYGGSIWGAVRLSDCSVAQTAYAIYQSRLWLPGLVAPVELKVATLSDVGKRGWHDINIAGSSGPFTKAPPSPTSTYPALWSHNAKQETRLVCQPDSQLLVKPGMEDRASVAWATSSHAHINRDFRFNSQPLTAAFTEQPCIGGRAWPNVAFDNKVMEYAFVVWANGTLGLLSYWWNSNRQVAGRGSTSVSGIETLRMLDFRALTNDQLLMAEMIFNEFRDKELKPAYLADADPNRALLDRRVVCDLLGFDEGVYEAVRRLSRKWCAEPSVHGGKKRPRDAQFVM